MLTKYLVIFKTRIKTLSRSWRNNSDVLYSSYHYKVISRLEWFSNSESLRRLKRQIIVLRNVKTNRFFTWLSDLFIFVDAVNLAERYFIKLKLHLKLWSLQTITQKCHRCTKLERRKIRNWICVHDHGPPNNDRTWTNLRTREHGFVYDQIHHWTMSYAA